MRRNVLIAVLAVVALVCLSEVSLLHAQEIKPAETTKEDDKQVLRALLDEMRQLRLALQRSNAVNQRLQITLERLRLQQVRVDTVARSLENVRARINDLKGARPQMEEQVRYAEEVVGRETEPKRREEIEHQVKDMKARLASWLRDEEQLREREGTLNTELQIEQNKLNEIHLQLDNMMKQLEGP